ncbi:hypothetical protein NUACC21_64940 [Scytonema sp. NUACC21]
MQVASNQLFIEDLAGNNNEIRRGSTAKRRIRVKNLGDRMAEIDIWIDATDEKSESILRWCNFSEPNPLRIDARDSKEVTLNFQVPPQAIPGLYNYEIRIEAAAQYPGKIFNRPQQLRVLPADKDAEWGNEPGFSIQPVTSSANPIPLHAGQQLEVKVKVENRSKRVDRFYLTCPELTKEWYTIRYPESGLDVPGLVKETDGLELNPGKIGEIALVLHPPQYTATANYFPTIRLISSNREDLVLLDVIYLQILPDDRLNVEMHPLSQKVQQERVFEVELTNQGNIRREILVSAKDEEGLFNYIPEPAIVQMLPGNTRLVSLKVKPRKWWRRPWQGKGLSLTFNIELENILLPEVSKPPALPNNLPQGTLVWEPYPWWLLCVLGLAGIGGIAFLIWWNFLREKIPPPPSPKVIQLGATSLNYQEGRNDGILLNWQISHPKQIEKLTLIRLEGNIETDRKNYLFQDNLPKDLLLQNKQNKNKGCEITTAHNNLSEKDKTEKQQGQNGSFLSQFKFFSGKKEPNQEINILDCQKILTNSKKAGNYTFKLEVFPKQNPEQPSSSQITDTIKINPATPLPLPKILNLSSTYPAYEEVDTDSASAKLPINNSVSAPILLNWEISSPSHIKELKIIGKAPDGSVNSIEKSYTIINNDIPPQLRKYCQPQGKLDNNTNLLCNDVPINDARKPGDYIFTLTVVPQTAAPKEGQEEIFKQTPTIKIQPLPLPQITDFLPAKPIYQEVGTVPPPQNIATQPTTSSPPIRLNWRIANPSQMKELKIVALAADGSISGNLKRYIIINNSLPVELRPFCVSTTKELFCQNVPTDVRQAGNYTFKMTAIPKSAGAEITKNTDAIKIQPQPPKAATPVNIVSFKINGEEASQKPKHSFTINKQRSDANITVSWQVDNGEDIKVEVLPAPGIVNPQGSLENYSLSKPPSSETITLRVTNKAGEQKTQSVVIETVESNPPNQSQSSSFNRNSGITAPGGNSESTASPQFSNSDKLAPIEVPPLAD